MRTIYFSIAFFILLINASSQDIASANPSFRMGNLYVYWGWNSDTFSKSDITFTGKDYDFTLTNVVAEDRQSRFTLDKYFNPTKLSIPQYNFRVGYFLTDNWDVSFAIDHMKYVVQENQVVKISGEINDSQTDHDGTYSNDDKVITPDFLKFEHTDGLNYLNFALRRSDQLYELGKFKLFVTEGLEAGLLVPRTNTTLLGNERYDEFHVSGYGFSTVVGLNITFVERFFIQSEFKGGFINMPDIRTTKFKSDRASQHFFFSQLNILFGGIIRLGKKE